MVKFELRSKEFIDGSFRGPLTLSKDIRVQFDFIFFKCIKILFNIILNAS